MPWASQEASPSSDAQGATPVRLPAPTPTKVAASLAASPAASADASPAIGASPSAGSAIGASSAASSSPAIASSSASTKATATATDTAPFEVWRSKLSVDDLVSLRSASAGGWLQGKVTQTGRERVKVEYVVGSERCDKTLLRSSPDLREFVPQAPKAASAMLPAPVAAAASPAKGYAASPVAQAQHQAPSPQTPGVGCRPDGAVVANLQHSPLQPKQLQLQAFTIRVAELTFGEHLGSGGFGSVNQGLLRGQEVAIKKLHMQDGANISKDQLDEFNKEASNLASLSHPRLIRFIGAAFEPPVLCIVTELASGGSLYKLLHSKSSVVTDVQKRNLVLQVMEGVAFLHGRRPPCVHRDLKSANVVLDKDMNAKLCDFGLTETMEKTHISRGASGEGGSPRYMAPEVFDARSKLTEKLDVWALGCLTVEILTQVVPHVECSSIQQVAAKLLVNCQPPYEDSWGNGYLPEARRAVTACFEREPASRSSAADLLEALQRLPTLRETVVPIAVSSIPVLRPGPALGATPVWLAPQGS